MHILLANDTNNADRPFCASFSKVRISLGLKPLQPDSDDEGGKDKSKDGNGQEEEADDPLHNQEEKAAKNYAKYQEDLIRKKEEEEIRQRIARWA